MSITGVEVGWAEAAGYTDKEFQPLTCNTLNVPLVQQIFTTIYLGIAEGALATAGSYTRTKTRAWPYGTDPKDSATQDPYILQAYGELRSRLWAGQAFAEAVDAGLSHLLHAPRRELTDGERGRIAVRVAASKQVANDVALDTSNRIYELTGPGQPPIPSGWTSIGAISARIRCMIRWPIRSARSANTN